MIRTKTRTVALALAAAALSALALASGAMAAAASDDDDDAVKEIDPADPTSELSRFEERIRREEAKVAGKAELAASRLVVQFEALEDEETTAEVEARLKELTGGTTTALPVGGSKTT